MDSVISRDQSRQTILILATLCVTYFVENFIRSSASSLSPILIAELGISLCEMGLSENCPALTSF